MCYPFLINSEQSDLPSRTSFAIFQLQFKFIQILEFCCRFESIWKIEKQILAPLGRIPGSLLMHRTKQPTGTVAHAYMVAQSTAGTRWSRAHPCRGT
jgi:hypothetical protein